MLDSAVSILKRHQGQRLVVGVSGGVDSMSLLWLILNCGFFNNKDITVIHVDHNLRDTSKRDKNLVEEFCEKNNIESKILSADVSGQAKQNKRSIETEARHIRHQLFNEYCNQYNSKLALAHTMDDQAETVLMHIFRGSGLNGLAGMSQSDKHIIRPFIDIPKKKIYEFAKINGIPFFEDETNQDIKYSRNLIRELLISVQDSYPSAKDNIALLSKIARDANSIILNSLNGDYFSFDGKTVLLNKAALTTQQAPYYIIESAKKAGLMYDLEFKHVKAIQDMTAMRVGGQIDLVHNLIVYNERENIAFEFNKSLPPKGMQAPFTEGENNFFDYKINASPCKKEIEKGKIIVDADKLKGTVLRFRQDGDRFLPCGGRQKKLKEYLNDIHIPNRKKDFIPLICVDNEVLVIAGIELSDKVKLDKDTKRAIRIELL